MQAIILAAGKGSRLGLAMPKCLVSIAGKTIIQRQIQSLRRIRPDIKISVVIGYKYKLVQQHIKQSFKDINLIYNPFHECAGILGSAWLSLPYINGSDVIRLDADVFWTDDSEFEDFMSCQETTLVLGSCHRIRTTPIVDQEHERVVSIHLVENYTGKIEWSCIELYRDGDYNKVIRSAKNLVTEGYYFDAINNAIASRLIKGPQTYYLHHIYEIDSPKDIVVARSAVEN